MTRFPGNIAQVCRRVDPVEQTSMLDDKSKCVVSISDELCLRYKLDSFELVFFYTSCVGSGIIPMVRESKGSHSMALPGKLVIS